MMVLVFFWSTPTGQISSQLSGGQGREGGKEEEDITHRGGLIMLNNGERIGSNLGRNGEARGVSS